MTEPTATTAPGPDRRRWWRPVLAIAGLKWALLVGGARGTVQSRIQLLISVTLSLVFGFAALVLLMTIGSFTDVASDALVTLLAATAIGVGLLSAATGVEASLDPRQLGSEPLTPTQLGLGMLLAGTVGPPAILALLSGIGLFIGWRGRSPAGGLVLVLVIVIWWLTLLLFSRTTANVLGMWATGRFRHLAQALATGSALLGWLIVSYLSSHQAHWNAAGLHAVARVAAFTPPGQLGHVVTGGGPGRPLALLFAISWLPLLVWASVRSTARLVTVPPVVTDGRTMRPDARGVRARLGFVRRWVPGPVAAVALRSLQTKLRTPRQTVNTVTALVVGGGVMVLGPLLDGGVKDPRTVMVGGLLQFAVLFDGNNAFGVDGPGLWAEIQAGATGPVLVRAKVLTSVLTIGPFALLIPVVLAAMGNGWQWLPAALLIAAGSIASASGVAVLTASLAPVAMPASANPLAAGDTGQGCVAGLMLTIGIMVLVVTTAPFVLAVYYLSERTLLGSTVVAGLALGAGLGLLWATMRLADGRLSGHEAALVDLVTPRR